MGPHGDTTWLVNVGHAFKPCKEHQKWPSHVHTIRAINGPMEFGHYGTFHITERTLGIFNESMSQLWTASESTTKTKTYRPTKGPKWDKSCSKLPTTLNMIFSV
jgi:hypothetical protein